MIAYNASIRSTKSFTSKSIRLAILTALVAFLTLSCEPILLEPTTGSMELTMNDGLGSRTLLPDISMDVASYSISGAGPDGASFSETTVEASTTLTRLVPGTWNMTVTALNSAGTAIGEGTGTTEIVVGETAALTVTVRPYTGVGTLNVTVSWPTTEVTDPVVNATLVPSTGTEIPLTLSGTEPGTLSVSKADLANGYYTLIVQLYDGTFLAAGAVEVARIVKDGTTTGDFVFSNIKDQDGDVTVVIDPDMQDPLTVSLSGTATEVNTGDSMSVTADVSGTTETPSYQWYLDGQAVGTDSATYSTPTDLAAGTYSLSVVATTSDGSSGSTSHSFTVVEVYEPILVQATEFTLYWDPPTDATGIDHYNVYYRAHGTSTWTSLGTATATATPSYTVTSADLAYGVYDFAVTSVNTSGVESDMHCSLDPNADPTGGWYVDWQAP
jgi:hypothetical protein